MGRTVMISIALFTFLAPLHVNAQTSNVPKLTGISLKEYEDKVIQLCRDLGSYLTIIVDKRTDWRDMNTAIDNAVALFINEDATIEVSSLYSDNKTFKVREYLNRLKLLDYTKIKIEWTEVYYVTNIYKGTDGYYYGTVSIEQKFSGYRDNKVVYEDYTTKNIEVVLKPREVEVDGAINYTWDILFTKVFVTATKPTK